VKITVISEQGKEAVVAILGANDLFGEGCLAGQVQRIATAVTMMDSVVVTAGKSRHSPRDPSGTSVPRDINRPSCGPGHPRRSRPRRSAVQFERQQGLIRYNGHIEVHSSLLNVVLHDEPHIEA